MTRPRAPWSSNLTRAVDLGEERVVLAEPDVQARTEPAPALTHEDRSAGHDVAVEALDAEPLRVAVAPVTGTALSFFCAMTADACRFLDDDVGDPHAPCRCSR